MCCAINKSIITHKLINRILCSFKSLKWYLWFKNNYKINRVRNVAFIFARDIINIQVTKFHTLRLLMLAIDSFCADIASVIDWLFVFNRDASRVYCWIRTMEQLTILSISAFPFSLLNLHTLRAPFCYINH